MRFTSRISSRRTARQKSPHNRYNYIPPLGERVYMPEKCWQLSHDLQIRTIHPLRKSVYRNAMVRCSGRRMLSTTCWSIISWQTRAR